MQFWWTVDDKNEIMLSRSSDSNFKKLSKWSISCMITRAAFSQVTFNDCPQLFFLHLVAFSMGQHWLNNMATTWVSCKEKIVGLFATQWDLPKFRAYQFNTKEPLLFTPKNRWVQHKKRLISTPKIPQSNTTNPSVLVLNWGVFGVEPRDLGSWKGVVLVLNWGRLCGTGGPLYSN